MQPPKILPPHYFLASLVLMIGLTFVLEQELFGSRWVYVGSIPMLVGIALAASAARQFSSVGTNIIPLTESSALVSDGVFAWSRNPMYTGMVLFLGGLSLLLDNPWNWLLVAAFFLTIRQRFVLREEQLMFETFGAEYASYKSNVQRWI
jgi:protein-S-isoprenylcysteine O-methyltransferase Ste14